MLNQFSRTELIYGRDAMEMLKDARVAVFGIGGVGGLHGRGALRAAVWARSTSSTTTRSA